LKKKEIKNMKMTEVLKEIIAHNTIIIHGHKRPDGDCYGGQFGMKSIIKENFPDKKVFVVGEESQYVSYVGKPDTIDDSTYDGALVIIVDTATEERISDPRYRLGQKTIKIDHHIDVDAYADMNFVDTSFPAVSETVTNFAVENNLKIGLDGAIALYTGILTDTGRFRYRGVSQRTHQMAGYLVSLGVDVEFIDQQLSTETLENVALKGYVYSNFVTTSGGFIYIKMTNDVISTYGVTKENAAAMVNLIGGIEGYPVWALFMEYDDEIRIRLRSNGPTINGVAEKFSGGGHAKASGASIKSWDDIELFVEEVESVIKKNKEDQA
jgi:phosphoesterase RecJ-like protein